MKIHANQLSTYLKRGLAPCYLVTGDEHLLVAEALDAIRARAREEGFTSRDLHVASPGFDWSLLRDAGSNLSLFAERSIVELVLPTGKPGKAGGAAIVDLVERLHPDTLLIVTGPKLDRSAGNAKWAKTLDGAGVSLPVWPIERRELPAWIDRRMKAAGLAAERDAVMLIADRVEGNLLAASQEIEKLRLILGEGAVSTEAVADAVANSSRFDVYKLADAALAGDAARALRVLAGLRAEGVEPVLVVWALTRELRTLARLAEATRERRDLGAAMQKNGVWRNRQALVKSALSRHSLGSTYRLLKTLGRADAMSKGQAAGDPWQRISEIVVVLAGRVGTQAA
ncbi:MAG: DNA polymerase III subunit delta [Pseudomonadota bacterium]